jgi:hypothetical protein
MTKIPTLPQTKNIERDPQDEMGDRHLAMRYLQFRELGKQIEVRIEVAHLTDIAHYQAPLA